MSASLAEVHAKAQELLDLCDVRIRNGQLVVHIGDFQAKRVDVLLAGVERTRKGLDRDEDD